MSVDVNPCDAGDWVYDDMVTSGLGVEGEAKVLVLESVGILMWHWAACY